MSGDVKTVSDLCREALELREKALFKGRVRFDKEGDLVCDALSGVLDSVKVIASSSEKSVLMDEDALFFAHAANHIKQIAKKYLELESENKKLREALKVSENLITRLDPTDDFNEIHQWRSDVERIIGLSFDEALRGSQGG